MTDQAYAITPANISRGDERIGYCLRHAAMLLDIAASNVADSGLVEDEKEQAATDFRQLRNLIRDEVETWKP